MNSGTTWACTTTGEQNVLAAIPQTTIMDIVNPADNSAALWLTVAKRVNVTITKKTAARE
jgi:hypothetical protein